jgi:hypothetical protein
MATATLPETAPKTQQHGWPHLRCIICGDEGTVHVNLADVHSFNCNECTNEFSDEVVRQQIEAWTAVLAWADLAPVIGQ